ncbi:hypothetical protein, partial [Xanthobacter agilis]|uniref:hypothetical protein n=1 Tax=Xanthobacter agilis TaxID=47492 RepID=UPI00372B991C
GFLRDRMPWLAEVMVEAHRDLKTATPEQVHEIGHNLMAVVKMTTRGPWGERMMERSKSGHILIMELPHLIERAISQKVKDLEISDLIGAGEDIDAS